MNENKLQKCRTCLKSTTKTFPLTKPARGCNPKTTYGEILKEYAKLEGSNDYEHLMPQFLCFLCCRELRNAYNFIRQAQYCNTKLIDVISKQLDCLQERIIDLPQQSNQELEEDDTDMEIKLERMNEGESINKVAEVRNNEEEFNESFERNELASDSEDNKEELNESDLKTDLIREPFNTSEPKKESPSNEVKCPICNKLLNPQKNLLNHMHSHHDIERPDKLLTPSGKSEPREVYECKLCPSKYTNKYSLLYHLKNKHDIAPDEQKQHKEKKVKEKIIKCRLCDYTARTYAALNYHNRSKHGSEEDKFKCKFCSYTSLKKFDLLTHVKNSHKELIKTLKAEASEAEEKGKELQHEENKVGDQTKRLPDAYHSRQESEEDGTSSSEDDNIPLAQRISNFKSHTSNPLTSPDKEEFSDEEFIRNILNIKKRQPKSQSSKSLARRCHQCGNIYKDYKALYAHQRHVHISEDKYSLCPHCGKKYKRKTDLRIHIEKAHGAKPPQTTDATTKQQPAAKVREKRFMCPECSYVCTTITILNIHRNRHHTGEKPYKCDICFKSFIVPYDLKIHSYLHTGERPYKCPVCSKGFRDNSHMIKHKRIHSSERPYKCKDCGKSFTQSYNLSVHKRTHLKEKQLNCAECGKVFENRSLLNLHRINENHHDEVV